MRWAVAPLLMLSGCHANAPTPAKPPEAATCSANLQLTASDGVKVFGRYCTPTNPKALILLFHQAGSSKDEYATIAPRLGQAGYATLAIDQRSGGDLFGVNETAKALGAARAKALSEDAGYIQALPDLEAALAWARDKNRPVVLWGSSYSSSLVLLLAAKHPDAVKAVLAFSPGEYLGKPTLVRDAAANVAVPVFVTSTTDAQEVRDGDGIFAALPKNDVSERVVPRRAVHGSSMLIPAKNPDGAEDIWASVLAFLTAAT